ncbi:MAG: DUF6456 domain-containing protein, partial [Beijerinckiaceae bacterium]
GAETRGEASPVCWLYRRKDASGRPLIGAAAFAAGERLSADILRGGMTPRVTMDWTRGAPSDRSAGPGGLSPTEAAMSARGRVSSALEAVGPELSGLLVDLCGFEKGLEMIEFERGWPARSAKVVARIALDALARHYGYADETIGRTRAPTRSWRMPAARSAMSEPVMSQNEAVR